MVSLSSEPLFQIGSIAMPSMIFYLFCNTGTQFICISAVYRLTSECPSLTVTLVVTLRKFFSLLFSIWYFNNPFTFVHWIGTAMVFAGTLLFSDIYGMIKTNRPEALKKFEWYVIVIVDHAGYIPIIINWNKKIWVICYPSRASEASEAWLV